MNGLMMQVSFIIVGAALMLALLGLGVAVIMPGIDRWSKLFFEVYFLALALYISLSLTEEIGYIRTELFFAQKVIIYLETLVASLLMPLMMVYLLRCCGGNWRHSKLFCAMAVLWGIFFILLNITPFTSWFYEITPGNHFLRGPLYSLITILLEAMQLLNLAGVIRRRSRLPGRYFCAFLIGLLPMAITMLIHIFFSVFELLAISVVVCALSMYCIILSEQVKQDLRLQREIARQRTSIMLLQMRPHFIYNTMMSIYYLCKQNPDLAQQVTMDFTTYLRKNFTAIASEELIPFTEELEHTRAYLAVEQAQFEDSLYVDYDMSYTDFRVPPLTLQPIVENAVKHGLDQDSEPLHIRIQTRRTDSHYEILVENNGTDFEPVDDGEPHIALKNIQQRLEMMCRGQMTIMPRKEGGTVVKVTIPRR